MKRKKARKQSSARLSTIAARVLAHVKRQRAAFKTLGLKPPRIVSVSARDVVALAASVLSQDETRGQK